MPHMGSATSPAGGQYSPMSWRASSGSILPGCRLEAGRYRPLRWYWALVWAQGQTASGTGSGASATRTVTGAAVVGAGGGMPEPPVP
jgi:hypothetical protein